MNITKLSAISKPAYRRIMNRSSGRNRTIMPGVRSVMSAVRKNGDRYLYASLGKRFGAPVGSLRVTPEEIRRAYEDVSPELISSMACMIRNITAVQMTQLPKTRDTVVRPMPGIAVWREWRPIGAVGLYIPGGRAIYPSSVFMSAIPAKIAGCQRIVMCSPMRREGTIPSATLVAADMIGLTEIYKIGGAEAIAAMAYGTETIPKVSKIFGAGNAVVTAAKTLALDTVSIDMPAGPSEIFIIADETADPAFIAADLLADGEHGPDSACVLVTTSPDIAKRTVRELDAQLSRLPTRERAEESLKRYGLVAVADTLTEAIAFCNDYAPEHLEIMTEDPLAVTERITDAGSVFLGNWTAKATGDYATGANHVLPTGGMARMYPPLGVDAFGKWMQVQRCTRRGLTNIREAVETVSAAEQLPAHTNSVSIRFMKKGKTI